MLKAGADETKKGNNLGVGMRSKHHGVGEEERESKRRDMFGREKLKKRENKRERERGGVSNKNKEFKE